MTEPGGGAIKPDPILLRFRSPADLSEQVARHEANALARAIHSSSNLRPLSAQQPPPHATPRVNCAGSALAGTLETLAARWRYWDVQAQLADRDRAWDDYERARGLADAAREQYLRRAPELGSIDTARSVPGGLSGVYVVAVPAYTVQEAGSDHAMTVTPTRRLVDTREASAEAQAWLRAYRHGGSVAMPYWWCKKRQRYYSRSEVPSEVRSRLAELLNVAPCSGK